MDTLSLLIIIVQCCILLIPSIKVSTAIDTIHISQSLSDGMTLVSKGEKFELGFFTPENSNKRYLGIWYKNIPIQTIVWVANDVKPINDSFGIFTLNNTGNLVLTHHDKVVWHTTSHKQAQNPIVQLLDSGNLVIRDESEAEADAESYLWQSFDYPSDTILPGMKLGWNLETGLERRMTCWKSPDDPSPGSYYWGSLLYNYPEQYLMQGTKKFVRIGPWNGLYFSGIPDQKPNSIFDFKFVSNKDEIYYMYNLRNESVISRMGMSNQETSTFNRYVWMEEKKVWNVLKSLPKDKCDLYATCGAYGACSITGSPICQCLSGFSPKSPVAWNTSDWSQGCVRNKPLNCTNKLNDGFVRVEGVKVPDSTHTWVDETIGLDECRVKCLNNCTCMAYTNSDISGKGSGCVMWFGDLIDIRQFVDIGQDLYVRMDASEFGKDDDRRKKVLIRVVPSAIILSVMLSLGYCIYIARRNKAEKILEETKDKEDLELPFFDFATIVRATNDFSREKKLGQGGFGPVYMGILADGQEIAVKRLSNHSGQGTKEFKNEVIVCAKLQHRNLVKVLGCSTRGEEKVLIYEYMPNKSLDSFLFGSSQSGLLNWSKRFNIIFGIVRGLLYLHQDSRLRIIHRDLKASNILLDGELNPKISDFGVARMFSGNQTEGNTRMVAGTYGYMAPEYAIDGLFSIKSDIFSFGVLLLEIVSGKKNTGVFFQNDGFNLLGHAWKLWKENTPLKLIDASLSDSFTISEALRCIHVGLLCVQLHPEDRPNMASVILMLSSENTLPQPKEPGFLIERMSNQGESSSNDQNSSSTNNELTLTLLEAR